LVAEPGEAGDFVVEGGEAAGGDAGAGSGLGTAAGAGRVGFDSVEMVDAAVDVADGEADGE
jgi:hypothetical protein